MSELLILEDIVEQLKKEDEHTRGYVYFFEDFVKANERLMDVSLDYEKMASDAKSISGGELGKDKQVLTKIVAPDNKISVVPYYKEGEYEVNHSEMCELYKKSFKNFKNFLFVRGINLANFEVYEENGSIFCENKPLHAISREEMKKRTEEDYVLFERKVEELSGLPSK